MPDLTAEPTDGTTRPAEQAQVPSRERPSVCIGVVTFRRPDQLRRLLPLLTEQGEEVHAAGLTSGPVDVLVVDNDPEGGAARVVRQAGGRVRYALEAVPGISAARNRVLDEAGTDVVAFIDDDEWPAPGWLTSLLSVHATSGAAAVAGRVVAEFSTPLHPWLAAGDFWERPSMPSGTPVAAAACGNLLVDLRRQQALGVRFDPAFGLGGGEDIAFTEDLSSRGGAVVWCEESVAFDDVPAERATRRWVLARAWSQGSIRSVVALRRVRGPRRVVARLHLVLLGAARAGGGSARLAWGVVARAPRHQARGLRSLLRGVGMMAGAVGHQHQEYAVLREGRTVPR